MKRILSIALCAIMTVSLFAVNVSAVAPTTYDEVVTPAVPKAEFFVQDFEGDEDTSFTSVIAGDAVTAEVVADPANAKNKSAKLTATGKGFIGSDVKGSVLSDSDRTVNFKFRVYPVNRAETVNVGVTMPALLNGYGSYTHKAHHYIIGYPNFNANAWNTVEIAITVPENYSVGTNPSYPDHAMGSTAAIKVNGTALTAVTGGAAKTAEEGKFGIIGGFTGSSKPTTAEASALLYLGIGMAAKTDVTDDSRTVYFDDIEAYKPETPAVVETHNYPINNGAVVYSRPQTTVLSAAEAGYDGSAAKRIVNETITAESAYQGGDILTFEARCLSGANSSPLSLQIANGTNLVRLHIAAPESMGNDWYTYKLVTQTGANDLVSQARKLTGTNNAYQDLQYKTEYLTGYGSGSSAGTKYIQLGYWNNKHITVDSAKVSTTVWEIKNIQVIRGTAITGKVTDNGDGTANVKTFFSANTTAGTPIVAVFNADKLVDVAYAAAQLNGDGCLETTVKYAAGNTAKMFIWDSITGGVPVLAAPYTLAVD